MSAQVKRRALKALPFARHCTVYMLVLFQESDCNINKQCYIYTLQLLFKYTVLLHRHSDPFQSSSRHNRPVETRTSAVAAVCACRDSSVIPAKQAEAGLDTVSS